MRNWIAKFRISSAADSGKPLSASLREDISRTDDLQRFEQTLTSLERALRDSVPNTETPPGLHKSIMEAVRAASQPAPKPGFMATIRSSWTVETFSGLALRWLTVPALAALVLAGGFWWANTRPAAPAAAQALSTAKTWAMPATALEQGGELARSAPSVAIAPLAEELARADQDFRTAAKFLLSSLP